MKIVRKLRFFKALWAGGESRFLKIVMENRIEHSFLSLFGDLNDLDQLSNARSFPKKVQLAKGANFPTDPNFNPGGKCGYRKQKKYFRGPRSRISWPNFRNRGRDKNA